MSKLIYSMLVSLDGFMEAPGHDIGWTIPDEELHAFANDQARAESVFIYGRKLYEIMAGFWPTADENPSASAVEIDFARIWKAKPKVVFSRTLDKVEHNSRLATGDIAEEVARLKADPGGDISVGGSDLAAEFMRRDLIDEYQILVHPIVLGAGKRFFPPLDDPMDLELVETRTFGSGVVYLAYRRARP
jgi:dihydrofolate reductase